MLLLETFNSQNQELRMLLESLPEKILFNKPKPEKWSIAEIVEHLNISDKGAYLALLKQGEIPTDEEKEASYN
jgi:DinB superfamily